MPPPALSRMILCVDDEADALLVRKAVLKSAGYEVVTALTAGDALAILRSSDIDLVITDHLLPGVTGIEMARQIKSAKPYLPILLLRYQRENRPGRGLRVELRNVATARVGLTNLHREAGGRRSWRLASGAFGIWASSSSRQVAAFGSN